MDERIFSNPGGFVPIRTNDCNAVIPKGDGGVGDLPVVLGAEGAAKWLRVAYPVHKRHRDMLRKNPRVALTVVIKVGEGGLEEISTKLQLVRLTAR